MPQDRLKAIQAPRVGNPPGGFGAGRYGRPNAPLPTRLPGPLTDGREPHPPDTVPFTNRGPQVFSRSIGCNACVG